MYINELPYKEHRDVCGILEANNCFRDLGAHMQFEEQFLENLERDCEKRGKCPIETLLRQWDIYGHTVIELFIIFYRMKLYEAMKVLKPFVPPERHRLIKDSNESEKILNGPPQTVVSRDDNITLPSQDRLLQPNVPPLRFHGASSMSLITESAGAIPQIPYKELQRSTNDWDDANILGKGGFGKVFKGTWKFTEVAIKRIERRDDSPDSSYEQIVQSNTELQCLNAYRHDNILPLYGYSVGGPQPCLIYQFMSGGSLDHRLHTRVPSRVLSWPSRLNIAVGTARGLQYLHTIRDKPLIHGDIKSANILLDPNDNPRIGDFGLARVGPSSDYVQITRIHGTRPYLPDEFIKYKKFSTKVDTYSFGVVLFELATGAGAYSDKRESKFRFLRDRVVNWEEGRISELKDPRAADGEDCFCKIVRIGKMCVASAAKNRPEMVEVLKMLELEQ